jgi:sulfite reductase (NADPH) flavoprotein alpha-component
MPICAERGLAPKSSDLCKKAGFATGSAPLTPAELAKTIMPLLPRFYSIANSAKVFPGEIHLLVAYIHYHMGGQNRRGVGSHFLCDLATIDATPVPIYLQSSTHFTLPQDPNASIILVGPGTGIAPYRAFIQERLANQSPGRNWIIFGERNRATDFYYSDFWLDLERQERIRLDLAFSRDGPEKIYVQHKMYEQRKSIWSWLNKGAYFYVCGDAEEMAKDVDAMLHRIVHEEGRLSDEDAHLYIKKMRADRRYLADVY